MTPGEIAALRDIADRAVIRDTLERFFSGIDQNAIDRVASCFTDDAESEQFGGASVTHGRDALLAAQRTGATHYFSHHGISNTVITLSGDTATADTQAIAVLVENHADATGRAHIRGLRYHDTFVRTPDGWRIRHRQHQAIWQFDADTVTPGLLRVYGPPTEDRTSG